MSDAEHFEPRRLAASALRRVGMAPAFILSRLSRRDPRVWLFGNRNGFRDSPRYLAEHIQSAHPEIEAWWVARSAAEAETARSAGLAAIERDSPGSVGLHRRAGAAFLCHGLGDVRAVDMGGACLVHLFHGTALKRTGLDVDFVRFGGGSLRERAFARLYRWTLARGWDAVTMFVAPSELARPRYVSAFGCPPEKVRVLGSPRFDVIRGGPAFDRVAGPNLVDRLGIDSGARVLLWLPTWRERGDAGWLPELDADVVERQLGGTNAILLVKPHPYSDPRIFRRRLPDHRQVRLLSETAVDVNCLLHLADQLITDYSSAAFDYSILGRPIHYLAPDIAAYGRGRDFYEPFESVTEGRHHGSWEPLLADVRHAMTDNASPGHVMAQRLSAHTLNADAPGSSERIAQAVAGLLEISLHAASAQ